MERERSAAAAMLGCPGLWCWRCRIIVESWSRQWRPRPIWWVACAATGHDVEQPRRTRSGGQIDNASHETRCPARVGGLERRLIHPQRVDTSEPNWVIDAGAYRAGEPPSSRCVSRSRTPGPPPQPNPPPLDAPADLGASPLGQRRMRRDHRQRHTRLTHTTVTAHPPQGRSRTHLGVDHAAWPPPRNSDSPPDQRSSRPPAPTHRRVPTANTTKPAIPNITVAALRSRSPGGLPVSMNTADHETPGPLSSPSRRSCSHRPTGTGSDVPQSTGTSSVPVCSRSTPQ